MSNVLDHEKQQQILALGRLGWTLRRIEEATGIRRETVSGYLRAAGVAVRGRGGQPKAWPPKPAITLQVSADHGPCTVHKLDPRQAARSYSCTSPPSRSRRRIASVCEPVHVAVAGRPLGGARFKLR
jgi:hypothetical protein